jgi:hypothetical protein
LFLTSSDATDINDLALVAAFQGDKSAAIAFAERATALVPIEKDALESTYRNG